MESNYGSDYFGADRERSATARLLSSGASELGPRPWRPGSAPPSAVDLAHFALWRSGDGDGSGTGNGDGSGTGNGDASASASASAGASGGSSASSSASGDSHEDQHGGMNADALLSGLTLLPAARAEVEGLEAGLLFTARSAGLTWAQIADVMGFRSPQACQQHFTRLTGRLGERS